MAEYEADREKRDAELKAQIAKAEEERKQREIEYQAKLEHQKKELEAAKAKRSEEEKQRSIKNYMFLRLLKTVLKSQNNVESAKQALFCHQGFSVEEAFALIDANQDGIITAQEISDCMTKQTFDTTGLQDLMSFMNKNNKEDIPFNKFKEAIAPMLPVTKCGSFQGSFEAKETQKMAWLESLLDVLTLVLTAQVDHEDACEKFQINAAEIFEHMDAYKVGYVTSAAFGRWVHINCGFHLSDNDLLVLMPIIYNKRNHRIEKEEFMSAFAAPELTPDIEETKEVDPKKATADKTAGKTAVKAEPKKAETPAKPEVKK